MNIQHSTSSGFLNYIFLWFLLPVVDQKAERTDITGLHRYRNGIGNDRSGEEDH